MIARWQPHVFHQQPKLTGLQPRKAPVCNCARRVRFNEVPGKVLKVPEKVWEALVQSQVRFNKVPEKVHKKVWEALVHAELGQFQRGSEDGSEEGSKEGSGEGRQKAR